MKRIMLALVALLAVTMFSCSKDENGGEEVEGKSILGVWEVIAEYEAQLDGKGAVISGTVESQDLSKDPYKDSYEFRSDNTGTTTWYDEWTEKDDKVTMRKESEEFIYILKGKMLTVYEPGERPEDGDTVEVSWDGADMVTTMKESGGGKNYLYRTTYRKK